jgi:hypothetical protein
MGQESSLGRAGNHLEGAFERVGRFPEVHHHAVAQPLDEECRRPTYGWEEHANQDEAPLVGLEGRTRRTQREGDRESKTYVTHR